MTRSRESLSHQPVAETQTLGDLIRAGRKTGGYTLEEIAMRYGKSKPYWSRVENNRLTPTHEEMELMKGALGWEEPVVDLAHRLIFERNGPKLSPEVVDLTNEVSSRYGERLGNAFLEASKAFPGRSAQLIIRDFLSAFLNR